MSRGVRVDYDKLRALEMERTTALVQFCSAFSKTEQGQVKTDVDPCTESDPCGYLERHNHGWDCAETCPCVDTRFRQPAAIERERP